jgi:ATP-dependent exoDNAse (exonuclease V) beta subunit
VAGTGCEIEAVLENSGLDRRKFNRGNQGKWIEKINAWAQEETLGYQLPDALEKFSQPFLHERTKAGGEPPVHPLFSAVEELLASPLTLTDLVIARAMVEIREAVARKSVGAASSVLMTCSAGWMTRCAARAEKRWPAPFVSVSRWR